jgi:hypothetical protein
MWPEVFDPLTLEIQQAQGLYDMLPYFPAVTTYHISFSTVLNIFEIFTDLDVIFLWHILTNVLQMYTLCSAEYTAYTLWLRKAN